MKKVINSKEESIFLDSLKDIVKSARKHAYSSICFAQAQSNWLLGKRIVEQIQKGNDKAEYGKHILKIASESLTEEFGKGYDESNLRYMRLFYKTFPICDALRHELSWTHYRRLISVENQDARLWYMNEAANSVWSTRQLDRQISTLYYDRLLASHDKKIVTDEAKEKLQRYDAMRLATINIPQEIQRLEIDAQSIRSARTDSATVEGGGNRREEAMINNILHRQELTWTLQQAQIWLQTTDRALTALNSVEKQILHRLYIVKMHH